MASQPFIIHPDYILREGLSFLKVPLEEQRTFGRDGLVRLFKSHYGRHPLHLSRVHRDLQVAGLMSNEEARKKESFHGFMLANNLLRCYEEADNRYTRFNLSFDEIPELSWDFIARLALLKEWKIRFPTVWPCKLGASTDGTHCRTNEPRDPDVRRNPVNYSFKHNFAGLNYVIVLSLWTNEIWHATSGDPASVHDLTAIREEFLDLVPLGCRIVADKGFTGKTLREKRIFAVENTLDPDHVKKFKGKAKARQEQLNSRLKVYKCLQGRFRHGVEKHKQCFAACLVLEQYAIEDTSPVGEPLNTL